MPLTKCSSDGHPGWRWGTQGACYIFKAGDHASEKAAKKKALKQAVAESYNGGESLSFKDRGIIAVDLADAKAQLEQIEREEAEAAKMAPPQKEDRSEPAVQRVPAQGYESVDSEELVSDDCQTNLMQDRVSENQDYVPSDSE